MARSVAPSSSAPASEESSPTIERGHHLTPLDHFISSRKLAWHGSTTCTGRWAATTAATKKAPAAICRKVALAAPGGTIDVWGDGKQARSFLYVADCVEGLHRLMASDCSIPLNLDSTEIVTVDQLVKLIAEIAGKLVRTRHNMSMPQGVRVCRSDNTSLRDVLGWAPQVTLPTGLARSYAWIVPGTGVPEPGGLSMRDSQVILRGLTGLDIVGGDVCEVAPPLDPSGITCIAAANLMFEILCLITSARTARGAG